MSATSTSSPRRCAARARCVATVVLPDPPFSAITATVCKLRPPPDTFLSSPLKIRGRLRQEVARRTSAQPAAASAIAYRVFEHVTATDLGRPGVRGGPTL